jgi:hypothetical protein
MQAVPSTTSPIGKHPWRSGRRLGSPLSLMTCALATGPLRHRAWDRGAILAKWSQRILISAQPFVQCALGHRPFGPAVACRPKDVGRSVRPGHVQPCGSEKLSCPRSEGPENVMSEDCFTQCYTSVAARAGASKLQSDPEVFREFLLEASRSRRYGSIQDHARFRFQQWPTRCQQRDRNVCTGF